MFVSGVFFFFLTFFSHILKDEALVKNPRILQVFLISSYKEKEDTNMRSTSFLFLLQLDK